MMNVHTMTKLVRSDVMCDVDGGWVAMWSCREVSGRRAHYRDLIHYKIMFGRMRVHERVCIIASTRLMLSGACLCVYVPKTYVRVSFVITKDKSRPSPRHAPCRSLHCNPLGEPIRLLISSSPSLLAIMNIFLLGESCHTP